MENSDFGAEQRSQYDRPEKAAAATSAGIREDRREVVRGGEGWHQMIDLDRTDPVALGRQIAGGTAALDGVVAGHWSL